MAAKKKKTLAHGVAPIERFLKARVLSIPEEDNKASARHLLFRAAGQALQGSSPLSGVLVNDGHQFERRSFHSKGGGIIGGVRRRYP
jgi:hypothetical protein